MRKFLFLSICLYSASVSLAQMNLNSFVNPFIGTGGHGHTFPGAVLPNGMVQLSPDTRVDGSWDGCSGYHYSDEVIYGFSHTHLSGTGCTDYGDILLMPMSGTPSLDNKIYSSKFSHKDERASPGYYEVMLEDDKIKAELTATIRVGVHKYSFAKGKEANLILDLAHRDKLINSQIVVVDSVTITGYRISEGWAKSQHVYFVIKFSRPFLKKEIVTKDIYVPILRKNRPRAEAAYFQFDSNTDDALLVKVGISNTGVEGAIKNLEAEATHWDFEKYKKHAEDTWNKQLQKIEVSDPDKEKMSTFYTALYHCFIHPSVNMDVDGKYRGRDEKFHIAKDFTNYSVFSLWDTYRALNPLMTIIETKKTSDFINTFLVQYMQGGRLPMWELAVNETDCMIGFHSVAVITDAMTKGIKGFDAAYAYLAMKAAATHSAQGIPTFNEQLFLQIDDESESVSKSLEYAYDNWCIAKMGLLLNKKENVGAYLNRAQAYKNLFDPTTGFMRPRKNGNWLSPFYPEEINNHFTEGNSWQYSFYVPHDIAGLIQLHGGKENFEKKLDELFSTSEKTRGRNQADVTGLIGQYAHGNEPSHHMAYLYNYIGKPQKTIERVQQICKDFYKNNPEGLIGNEDCGQMSAWYVFSSMGFYPVCPGSEQYALGEPIFKNIKINLENGKSFIITADASGKPVKEVSVNTKNQMLAFIDHKSIAEGGTLNFKYESTSKEVYGAKPEYISMNTPGILPSPLISSSGQVFKSTLNISISNLNSSTANLYYTLDGKEPTKKSTPYRQGFIIDKNTTVKVKAFNGKDTSATSVANFFKIKYDYDITINSKADPQYASEGSQTMIDGIIADENWRKGNWLGYSGQDFECIIDMKEQKEISKISLNFLQDSRSWIVLPSSVSFYSSPDNKSFNLLETVNSKVTAEDQKLRVSKLEKQFPQKIKTRYLKIVARNYGKLPEGHPGKGDDAYIFVDELEIR